MQPNLVYLRFVVYTRKLPFIRCCCRFIQHISFIPILFGSQNTHTNTHTHPIQIGEWEKKCQTIKWVLDFHAKCNIVFLNSFIWFDYIESKMNGMGEKTQHPYMRFFCRSAKIFDFRCLDLCVWSGIFVESNQNGSLRSVKPQSYWSLSFISMNC